METRKFKKHMVEKRRRTRINHSLLELKELVLEAFCKDASKYDKMEKADILDLTVKYLERITTERISTHRIRACQAAAALSMCSSNSSPRVPPIPSNFSGPMPSTSLRPQNPTYPSYMNCKSHQSRGIDINNNVLCPRPVTHNIRHEDPFNISRNHMNEGSQIFYDKSSSLNRHSTNDINRVYDLRSKERQTAIVKPLPRHALPKRSATVSKIVEPIAVKPPPPYNYCSSPNTSHSGKIESVTLRTDVFPLHLDNMKHPDKISFMNTTMQAAKSRCNSWRSSLVV